MALTRNAISSARSTIREMQGIQDSIMSEAKLIKALVDENPEYYTFCQETEIGSKYNDTFQEFIDALNRVGEVSNSLVASTNSFLNRQEAINRATSAAALNAGPSGPSANLNRNINYIQ